MSKRKKLDVSLLAVTGGLYLLGRLWWRDIAGGWLRYILVCYYSDVLAGIFILAWLDLLLVMGRFGRVHTWKQTMPFLFACGLVWECLASLWKAGAVFDPWDFLAYQVGGCLYLLILRCFDQK